MRTLSSTEWIDRLALKVLVVNTLDLSLYVDYEVAKVRQRAPARGGTTGARGWPRMRRSLRPTPARE
jgi:hypothetical protein